MRIRSTSGSPPSSWASAQVAALSRHISGVCRTKRRSMPRLIATCSRLDRVVAAVRVAGIVGLADAGDDVLDAAPIGERGGKCQEDQVAAGHESVRQAALAHRDLHVARQRRLGDRADRRDVESVVFAELRRPARLDRLEPVEQRLAACELDGMALAVGVADGLDMVEPVQAPMPGRWPNPARLKTTPMPIADPRHLS